MNHNDQEQSLDRPAEGRSVEGEIEIDAPIERVWEALTDARELTRWFPLDARVEPGAGGELWMSWKNEFAGTSRILDWDPPRRLLTTWGEFDGDQETGQRTEYLLESRGGTTFLRVVTSGFSEDPSWDAWVEGTRRGWAFELYSLKHYLENHPGEDRDVVYLRRRVELPRERAWERLSGDPMFAPSAFGGSVVDDAPPAQFAVVSDAPRGLVRLSVEPTHGGDETRDLTLWLSAWGNEREAVARVRAQWSERLAELFPEGTAV